MASSQNTAVPQWLTGMTYDGDGGNDLRLSGPAAVFYNPGTASGTSVAALGGVLGGGNSLKVGPGGGMNVVVDGGSFVVPSGTPTNGSYTATLASQATLTVQAASATNPRIDLVCGTVTDNGNSTSFGMVQIIAGTPAASPVVPSLPSASVPLAYVTVPANATSIVSGNVADERTYTAAVGGIIPVPVASAPSGYEGAYCHDPATHRLYHNSGSGPVQARVLPWAPVEARWNAGIAFQGVGSSTVTASVTFTTDGQTDIRITIHIPGIGQTVPATSEAQIITHLDASQIDYTLQFLYSTDPAGIGGHGFTSVYTTNSDTGDTPSAGTHTVSVYSWVTSGGAGYFGTSKLRVEPVVL